MKKFVSKLVNGSGYLLIAFLLLFSNLDNSLSRLLNQKASAAPGDGHMLLFWDGASIPSGWTCISCTVGDDFYQTFIRGNDSYGGTGGSATHTHAVTATADQGTGTASRQAGGTVISDATHSHTAAATVDPASNLPAYRQLNIIRSDTNGEPSLIPAGAIAIFDATVPTGWTQYAVQNGLYIRGENSVGLTGGSNTHTHNFSGTLGPATGTTHGQVNFIAAASAAAGHTHTFSGTTNSSNNEPPYVEAILGKIDADGSSPNSMLAMWDDDVPSNWTVQSGSSGSFYQRFIKPSTSFGATGGSETSTHTNQQVTSSGPSATANSFVGSITSSAAHTHPVNLTDYSSDNHLPPYRDVIIAKRVPQTSTTQSAYRFFKRNNSTDVGEPLAAQNSIASSAKQGTPFRVRLLLSISDANLGIGNKTYKLQYAQRSGTCDNAFSGETYIDMQTSSGDIRFFDNSVPSDGSALTSNVNDPDIGNTVQDQTYEESNNFTNSSVIATGEDGLWDFSLVDVSAPASTNYCLRVVYADGTPLESYTQIANFITDDGEGHMLLLWDGASIPTGWECVSCSTQDVYYQRFIRGSDSFGATGGSSTHNHTASATVGVSNSNTRNVIAGSDVASQAHTHTLNPVFSNANNLPQYRQLRVIRADTSGVPTTLPAGSIAYFDATVPAGWTQYAAQNGQYVRAEDTIGATGGNNTHNHTVTGTTSGSVGSSGANGGFFGTVPVAVDGHTHTINTTTNTQNHEPPYIEVILGRLNSSAPVPLNIITMWDEAPPGSWTNMSNPGGPLYQRFVKPAATYGVTGGSATHSHANINTTTSGPSNTVQKQNAGGTNSSDSHTHPVTISAITDVSNLPPYIEVIFAKLGQLNTTPNTPTSLEQRRTSNDSSISIGGFSNGGQVKFEASATDTDNPDSLQLCVEVELIGTAFDNVPTQCGSSVSYSGSPVTVNVTISGFVSGSSYHWQARVKDGGGGVSSWVSFGANPEANADFTDDSTLPSGIVYDGQTVGIDIDYNDGSLDELSANWNITDGESGIALFEYSVGTTVNGTDILNWTSNGTNSSTTATSLSLETSRVYYINVRATDVAGNQNSISSDGQLVSPSLSFTTSGNVIQFDNLNASNSFTDTKSTTLTTSTNARNGYEIRAYATGLLESPLSDTLAMFSGGTYAAPDAWNVGDFGFGFTSSDNSIQGSNIFNPATCAGGGAGPCFVPYSLSAPGDIVADNESVVSGFPITNESFTITHRVTAPSSQVAGNYQTTIIFSASARY